MTVPIKPIAILALAQLAFSPGPRCQSHLEPTQTENAAPDKTGLDGARPVAPIRWFGKDPFWRVLPQAYAASNALRDDSITWADLAEIYASETVVIQDSSSDLGWRHIHGRNCAEVIAAQCSGGSVHDHADYDNYCLWPGILAEARVPESYVFARGAELGADLWNRVDLYILDAGQLSGTPWALPVQTHAPDGGGFKLEGGTGRVVIEDYSYSFYSYGTQSLTALLATDLDGDGSEEILARSHGTYRPHGTYSSGRTAIIGEAGVWDYERHTALLDASLERLCEALPDGTPLTETMLARALEEQRRRHR